IIALNRFDDDTEEDLNEVINHFAKQGIQAIIASHYAKGGEGALDLAEAVIKSTEEQKEKQITYPYALEMSIQDKVRALALKMYGADDVEFSSKALSDIELIERHGYGQVPVCIAKSSKSLSDDDKLLGRPRGFKIIVNEARVSAGAGFVVIICGNIMTMPGLPKVPSATKIKMLPDGKAVGLS
ncbi:MAG: formate--tetrahydrofolate ligase, partial [Bacteroidales bacterium]|nr:formate--tetrahydrofolate ligase [Bacteroidales bacterium]